MPLAANLAGPAARQARSVRLAAPADLTQVIYADALATGWANWSWAQVNLANTSPVHSGADSIAVTFGAWQGLYLENPQVITQGYTDLDFFIDGGTVGGQRMNLLLNLQVPGQELLGPTVAITPTAGNWTAVRIPLATLNPTGATVTGITWQDTTGGSQPTFYLDDIDLLAKQDVSAPHVSGSSVSPRAVPADGTTKLSSLSRSPTPQARQTSRPSSWRARPRAPYRCTTTGAAMAPPATASTVRCLQYLRAHPQASTPTLSCGTGSERAYATLPLGTLVVLAPPVAKSPRRCHSASAGARTPGARRRGRTGKSTAAYPGTTFTSTSPTAGKAGVPTSSGSSWPRLEQGLHPGDFRLHDAGLCRRRVAKEAPATPINCKIHRLCRRTWPP